MQLDGFLQGIALVWEGKQVIQYICNTHNKK